MGAKQSAEIKHAIQLHKQGKTVYEAARIAGIYASTLYRWLKAQGKKKVDSR